MLDILELLAKPLLALARFLLWLSWDWFFHTISWSIGWPICRVLTFGRFPETGFRDIDETADWAVFIVCLIGLATLVGAIWLLSRHMNI